MSSTKDILLDYVSPAIGGVVACVMFTAPVRDVNRALERGTLGSLNPTPWAVMTANTTAWVIYSYLIEGISGRLFLFFPNAIGFLVSIYLNLAAVKLQYSDRNVMANRRSRGSTVAMAMRITGPQALRVGRGSVTIPMTTVETTPPHEKLVFGVVTMWLAVISVLTFPTISAAAWILTIAILANTTQVFFYLAPLSTMLRVLKTRDSCSIHRWTLTMNTVNAVFWTAFGFGREDKAIIIPNAIGAGLCFFQIALCTVIPSSEASTRSRNETARTSSKIQNVDTASSENDEEADVSLGNEIKDVVDSFDEFEKSLFEKSRVDSFQHPPSGKDEVDNLNDFEESLVDSPQHPPDVVDEDRSYLEFLKTL